MLSSPLLSVLTLERGGSLDCTIERKKQDKRKSNIPTPLTTTSAPTSAIFGDDETIAQVLITMSQNKEKLKEKEKGVELRDVEEIEKPRPTSTRSVLTLKPLPKIDLKDKGKKRIEEDESDESDTESEDITTAEKKFKQLANDEEMAKKIQEEWEAEEEKKRLDEEEATKDALIRNYDDIKARIKAERLQEEDREQFTVKEIAKFLHDTIAAQRRFLAQQWSEAIKNRPPTKNQLRNQMMAYLKHVGNFKHSDLKTKKFEEIQALYEKIKRSDEDFIAIGSVEDERQVEKINKEARDTKRKNSKKRIVKEEVTTKVLDEQEEQGTKKRKSGHIKMIARKKPRPLQDVDSDDEHRRCLKIITFDSTIDSEVMETKSIVAELHKVSSPDGDYLVVYRANRIFRAFNYLMEVLHIFNRQDLFHLYDLVTKQYLEITLEDQQEWEIVKWRLYESCGVCILELQDGTVIHMLVERRYPLFKRLLQRMLDLGLKVEKERSVWMRPRVLALENTNTFQAVEIVKLKERIRKLKKKRRSITYKPKRLYKGRKIADLDADAEVTLIDETQGRNDEDLMFNTGVFDGEEVFEEPMVNAATTTSSVPVSVADPIKSAKPKAVTTAATTVTPASTRTRVKGIGERHRFSLMKNWHLECMLKNKQSRKEWKEKELHKKKLAKQKSRMLMITERKKFFAAQRAAEQRSKPPTKAQIRNKIFTYLKNIVKGSETRTEGSSKRVGDKVESDKSKKQKIDEHIEARVDNDQEEAEMKKYMVIVQDDDELVIDAIPLATKPPAIVEWKIIKEGNIGYFQLIRADGSLKRYSSVIQMIQNIDKEDLETLWKLVKAKHGNTRPEEGYKRVLWGDLKVMFEHDVESVIWRDLQGYDVTVWKLFSSCGVHFVRFQNMHIFMLDEKKYPLTPATITMMLNKKLQADYWNEICYQLLKFMSKKINKK
ncbi:hypothetical protein Tco_0408969 [Tanacetum coccineum]